MGCEIKYYAIREVSELTGIKPVTLRAWQRRYNLVQPERTEKGHRLYTDEHLEVIRTIQRWLAKGVSIGKVSQLLEIGDVSPDSFPNDDSTELEEVSHLLDALANLHRSKVDNIIATVMKEYPLALVETRFIAPILATIDHMKGPLKTLHKGLFQSVMISKLTSIIEAENKSSHLGKCLCVSLDPVGSLYAWMWAVSLAEKGYNLTVLDGIDDLSGLSTHVGLAQFSALAVFANKSLSEQQQGALRSLDTHFGQNLYFSQVLSTLYDKGITA
jgi:DNA-binding transcriptional MerR regulator